MITASAVLSAGSAIASARAWAGATKSRQTVTSFLFWLLVPVIAAAAFGTFKLITEASSFRRGESSGRKTEIARQILIHKAAEKRLADEYSARLDAAMSAYAKDLQEAKRRLEIAENAADSVAKELQEELGKNKTSPSGRPYCRPGCIAWSEKALRGLK